ncbi:uncharacterized protein LOC115244852 [Formica exsecta]|uniref:uncharacterized protein LOC115244852 n=1 Tax=Formica exsecta TaxID=72781 RepID=UPI001142CEBF|nr:uncharacterized protein LOC115244852 [Formica exsecta]
MIKPSIQIISTLVDTVHVPLPVPDIGTDISMSFSPMEISSCEPPVADLLVPQEPFKVPSSIEISEQIPERNASTNDDFSAYVPESWSCFKMRTKVIQHTLFSYTIDED